MKDHHLENKKSYPVFLDTLVQNERERNESERMNKRKRKICKDGERKREIRKGRKKGNEKEWIEVEN